jgi:methylthioribose-1-phosphate isomerase
MINNKPITLRSADALHIGFDVTPAKYITGIITEKGILTYPYKQKILSFKKL